MIIISQDRLKIINFDNINMLRVANENIFSYDNTYSSISDADIIGIYKNKERAKEVLNEIVNHYYNYELTKVFRMPEE